jgi:hypothetical protein
MFGQETELTGLNPGSILSLPFISRRLRPQRLRLGLAIERNFHVCFLHIHCETAPKQIRHSFASSTLQFAVTAISSLCERY